VPYANEGHSTVVIPSGYHTVARLDLGDTVGEQSVPTSTVIRSHGSGLQIRRRTPAFQGFESLTQHTAQTEPGQHRSGDGPIFVMSGAVRPYPGVYGYSRPIRVLALV
jgi:hypothetical protein